MIHTQVKGNKVTIAVQGRFNLVKVIEVQAELKDVFAQTSSLEIFVDFAGTTFIDSSVERFLIQLRRKVGKEKFHARNASGAVLSALRAARLDDWLRQ